MNNSELVKATLRTCGDEWRKLKGKRQRNEDAFTTMVVVRVHCSLGWPRLLRSTTTETAAYHQWPKKHAADIGFFKRSSMVSLAEFTDLKGKIHRPIAQMVKRLGSDYPDVTLVLSGWYGGTEGKEHAGFAVHNRKGSQIEALESALVVELDGTYLNQERLAHIAAPVICDGMSSNDWLAAEADANVPFEPGSYPHQLQAVFQTSLQAELDRPVERTAGQGQKASPTKTYFAVPKMLPDGWFVAFNQDQAMNTLTVAFYENSGTHNGRPIELSFDDEPDMSPLGVIVQLAGLAAQRLREGHL